MMIKKQAKYDRKELTMSASKNIFSMNVPRNEKGRRFSPRKCCFLIFPAISEKKRKIENERKRQRHEF